MLFFGHRTKRGGGSHSNWGLMTGQCHQSVNQCRAHVHLKRSRPVRACQPCARATAAVIPRVSVGGRGLAFVCPRFANVGHNMRSSGPTAPRSAHAIVLQCRPHGSQSLGSPFGILQRWGLGCPECPTTFNPAKKKNTDGRGLDNRGGGGGYSGEGIPCRITLSWHVSSPVCIAHSLDFQ